jgi:hypothetical protein
MAAQDLDTLITLTARGIGELFSALSKQLCHKPLKLTPETLQVRPDDQSGLRTTKKTV